MSAANLWSYGNIAEYPAPANSSRARGTPADVARRVGRRADASAGDRRRRNDVCKAVRRQAALRKPAPGAVRDTPAVRTKS